MTDVTENEMTPAQVEEVAPGVFAYIQPDGTWFINNMGFVVGSDEVLVIDTTSTERRTRMFLDAIAARTDKPIRRALSTHFHGDHTNGNCLLPADTELIGHVDCAAYINQEGINHYPGIWTPVEWGDLTPRAPETTMETEMDLSVGDIRVELRHPGYTAHTNCDVVAWLPDQGVLFAGDLVFHGGHPFIAMGSLEGSLRSIEWMRAFGAATIVPGHGPVTDSSVLDRIEQYFLLLRATTEDGLARGLTPMEAARAADLSAFADLSDPERFVGNLHRTYPEVSGGEVTFPPGSSIAAMHEWNGGKPLCCLA